MFLSAALFAATLSVASATDAYLSVFTDSCTSDGAPVASLSVTVDECTAVETDSGTVYVRIEGCATDNGSWTGNVYADTTCSTTSLVDLSESTACGCDTFSLLGTDLAMRITCGAKQNNCYYYETYTTADCTGSDVEAATAISGQTCVPIQTSGSIDIYGVNTCKGGSDSDSWNIAVYTTSTCSEAGATGSNGKGNGCADCFGEVSDDDFFDTLGLEINCAGYNWNIHGECPMGSAASVKFSGAVAISAVAAAGAAAMML